MHCRVEFALAKLDWQCHVTAAVMDELQVIRAAVQRTARRRRWQQAWKSLAKGVFIGAAVWLVALAAYKVFPITANWLTGGAVMAAICALAGLLTGLVGKVSATETARWIDQQQRLQERLSTALEVSAAPGTGEWPQLVLSDAASHASKVDPRRLLPFGFPVLGRWALLLLALSAGLGFVPEYRSQQFRQREQDTVKIRQTGKQLAELTRQRLSERKPALEPTQKAMETVAEMGDKLAKASLTRSEALRDLASVTEKLAQQNKTLADASALKRMERAARQSGGTPDASPNDLQKRIDELQKQLGQAGANAEKLAKLEKELQKLQQQAAGLAGKDPNAQAAAREQLAKQLGDLAQQAKDMGVPLDSLAEAVEALKNNQTDLMVRDLAAATHDLEKLKEMAKAMQQLQQQAARLGKDLGEQLQYGQAKAAQSSLEKMIRELQSGNLTPEQLEKILKEVSKAVEPGSQFGEVGEYLKKAAQQMQQGQKPAAAQSLAQASKELEKLLQQMADAEAMEGMMDALERAQWALANGKEWGQCKACSGLGCSLCKNRRPGFGHGGRPGAGVGTWADETGWTYWNQEGESVDNSQVQRPDMDPRGLTDRPDDLNPNLVQTKVRGQMSPGGSMPSITLTGVSIKGQSTVAFEEAASSAQTEAESALNQDQVPRAYRDAVRNYFDDLKR